MVNLNTFNVLAKILLPSIYSCVLCVSRSTYVYVCVFPLNVSAPHDFMPIEELIFIFLAQINSPFTVFIGEIHFYCSLAPFLFDIKIFTTAMWVHKCGIHCLFKNMPFMIITAKIALYDYVTAEIIFTGWNGWSLIKNKLTSMRDIYYRKIYFYA